MLAELAVEKEGHEQKAQQEEGEIDEKHEGAVGGGSLAKGKMKR